MPTPTTIVLHSSAVRLVLSALTPPLLLLLGAPGLRDGLRVVPLVLVLLGVVALGAVLLDLPLRAELDADGVTRVCVLRRHRLPWTEVVALERVPVRRRRRQLGGGAGGPASASDPEAALHVGAHRRQGLVARLGPRRVVLLVDRRESFREHQAITELLRERATVMRAAAPPLDAVPAGRGPTALHRRD